MLNANGKFDTHFLFNASNYKVSRFFLHTLRCLRVFTEEPKQIPMNAVATTINQPKKTTPQAQKILTLIEKQKKEQLEQIQKKFQLTDGVK